MFDRIDTGLIHAIVMAAARMDTGSLAAALVYEVHQHISLGASLLGFQHGAHLLAYREAYLMVELGDRGVADVGEWLGSTACKQAAADEQRQGRG